MHVLCCLAIVLDIVLGISSNPEKGFDILVGPLNSLRSAVQLDPIRELGFASLPDSLAKDTECSLLCKTTLDSGQLASIASLLVLDYRHHWTIADQTGSTFELSVPLGNAQTMALYNHFDIEIVFRDRNAPKDLLNAVDIGVHPKSIQDPEALGCRDQAHPLVLDKTPKSVSYTYSVRWSPPKSSPKPSGRLDWLVESSAIFALTLIATAIIVRNIWLGRLSSLQDEYFEAGSGWPSIHGDVFRHPRNVLLLSLVTGIGAQMLLVTASVTVLMALRAVPSTQTGLTTGFFLGSVLFSLAGGYVSSWMYKSIGGSTWKASVLANLLILPAALLGTAGLKGLLMWACGSVVYTSASLMLMLLALWLLVAAPLTVIGSYLGFRHSKINFPVRTNQIPRPILSQPPFLNPILLLVLGGLLPFVAAYRPLSRLFAEVGWSLRSHVPWENVGLSLLILTLCCAQSSVIVTFCTVSAENYLWWWRSLVPALSASVYTALLFLYGLFENDLADNISTLVYSAAAVALSTFVFLVTGCVSYLCSLFFLIKLYQEIKTD